MEIISVFFQVVNWVLLVYFGLAGLYFFIFSIASQFYKEKKNTSANLVKPNVTILIPSYKEDEVIVETARSAMQHKSDNCIFNVLVIADSLKSETVLKIRQTGAVALTVAFEKSTKAKSMNAAIKTISNQCDYVVVLDADNIMCEGFLDNIVCKAQEGFKIVQGHRTAKNSNTSIAFLDGLSEEVNNAIFRKGHQAMGLSAALIGSAFICEFNLFRKFLSTIEAVGGFDKELELLLLKEKITIAYAQRAIVHDEKTQQSTAFVNQRRRWLSAQFIYFGKNFGNGISELILHKNIDYFDKVLQYVLPPRIITLGLTLILTITHFFLFMFFSLPQYMLAFWIIVFTVSSASVLISIPMEKYTLRMIKSTLSLPFVFLLTIIALLKTNGANKKFIHTPHNIN